MTGNEKTERCARRERRAAGRNDTARVGRVGITDDVFNLDPGKLLLVAVVAIMVLGPDKLPDVARRVGATWRSFNEFRHRMESEVRQTIPDLPSSSEFARLARSPAALLHHLGDIGTDATDPPAPGDHGLVAAAHSVDSPPASTFHAPRRDVAAAGEAASPNIAPAPGDAGLN